jgi:LPXTG-site transpeptidase (sortase) family protein
MKTGIIYSRGGRPEEVEIGKIRQILKTTAKILGGAGLALMTMSILLGGYVFWPMVRAELKYTFRWSDPEDMMGEQLSVQWDNEKKMAAKTEIPTWEVPDPEYSIYIPKIMAKSRVIPDVNANDPVKYLDDLKRGVAEAARLAHPGQKGTTYLFAHSVGSPADYARYNAVFYLLHRLQTGDDIEVVYHKTLYKYKVGNKEILNAGDVRYLTPQNKEEILVLSTCYPPGTSWQRLVIVAKRAL